MVSPAEYHRSIETTVRQKALTDLSVSFERRTQEYEQKMGEANGKIAKLERKVTMGHSALREAETLIITMDRIDNPEKSVSARRKILQVIQATLRELEVP